MVSSFVHTFLDAILTVYSQLYRVFWSSWERSVEEVWRYFTRTKEVLTGWLSWRLHDFGYSACEGGYTGECDSWEQQRETSASFTLTCNPALNTAWLIVVVKGLGYITTPHITKMRAMIAAFIAVTSETMACLRNQCSWRTLQNDFYDILYSDTYSRWVPTFREVYVPKKRWL
jgi:hypothetical protein